MERITRKASVQVAGLIAWVGLCYFVAWTGAQVSPGIAPADWYQSLNKPDWNPPAWLFGPVWSTLYTMMGIAAWLVWRRSGFRYAGSALYVFLGHLVLNGLWSQLFFGMQEVGWAFAEIILLLISIIATTWFFFRHNKAAGWLMVPYILWVGFATVLNGTIWVMN
ncbi:MAG: tryptophan-rich sensory protein [Balneolaceae bacterium]|nr:tryptophan-rich sensory protein [Balneolaceae bacterium]MCH8548421.1 tryptophan-rich sensory protein [Balneolaceae bacterium]